MFCDYAMSVTLYETGQVSFRLLGTSGLRLKPENERFILQVRFVVRTSNMKISRRCLADYVNVRAARAARLIFPIQPIRSLFSGVVVDVAVVVS